MKTPRRSPPGGCFVNGRFYRGGGFLPKLGAIVSADECLIAHAIVEETLGDEVYARAMAATLRGSKAVRHRVVLRSRRLRAIARLVEAVDHRGDRRAGIGCTRFTSGRCKAC